MTTYRLNLNALTSFDEDQFYRLCRDNPELKLERNTAGELLIMAPTGGETGQRNIEIAADFVIWNRRSGLGVCFDSSTGFKLPNGADRSPDVAWIEKQRWLALSPEQREKFPPIAPDFVLELLSPTDDLATIQAKMREYRDNGVRLGWLIDPKTRRAEIYRPDKAVEVLNTPATLSGESVLPGFELKLTAIWSL